MMKNIEIFYYLYIPNDTHFLYSFWWIDEQLSLLKSQGLTEVSNVNMVITMPKNMEKHDMFYFCKNGNNPQVNSYFTFEDKVREYINLKYPFVNILHIRDISEENIYERCCYDFLYEKASLYPEKLYLYFHSKGISYFSPNQKIWMEFLNKYLIKNWKSCVQYLNNFDVVGVSDNFSVKNNLISGNFWWATGHHIKSLPNPKTFTKERHSYELWIRKNNPNFFEIYNIDKDPYNEYLLLEEKDFMLDFNTEFEKYCTIETDIFLHLPKLKELSKECSSITELGVRYGISSIAFLSENVKLRSYDILFDKSAERLFTAAKFQGKDVDYIIEDSLKIVLDETDMLFIDTDHTYEQLSQELELHHNKVKKYIVMHDTHTCATTPDGKGLIPALIHFMIKYPEWKFKYHSTFNNGLTVIERN